MNRPGLSRAGWLVAGAALVLAGLAGTAPAPGAADVIGRVGALTVSATSLRPGPSGTLAGSVQVSTTAQASDQLDAAIASGGTAVAVYHQQVSVGEIPDLAGCGGGTPPPGVVDQWLHYGPLLVPGRSGGPSPPATATLTVPAAGIQPAGAAQPAGATVAITLYFANAGSVTVRLPVSRS
jgi:hypothetical protein